jgi:hypothetical protein
MEMSSNYPEMGHGRAQQKRAAYGRPSGLLNFKTGTRGRKPAFPFFRKGLEGRQFLEVFEKERWLKAAHSRFEFQMA